MLSAYNRCHDAVWGQVEEYSNTSQRKPSPLPSLGTGGNPSKMILSLISKGAIPELSQKALFGLLRELGYSSGHISRGALFNDFQGFLQTQQASFLAN